MIENILARLKDTFDANPTHSFGWVVLALLLAGLGFPLPEDIPLLLGGYACAQEGMPESIAGFHPVILMMVCGIGAILLGDSFVYMLGRFAGNKVQKWKWFMKLVGHDNLDMARTLCAKQGGRFIAVSRFMPGLRSPAFFAAGLLHMPYGRFLLVDGLACLFSAPIFLGWYFHSDLDKAKNLLAKGELFGFVILALFIAAIVAYKIFITKKIKKMKAEADLAQARDQEALAAAQKGEILP
jgi:membrane protein DedA with SNARE-associated domain